MYDMLAAILSGFLLAAFAPWVHRIGKGLSGKILALLPIGLVVYFSSFVGPISEGQVIAAKIPWIPSLDINLSFYLDGLSLLFALLITGVGALVVIYAGAYLAGNPLLGRFYIYILMFMGSMLGVVLSDNVITLFVFWELTSLTSYFLIGFENERAEARHAAWQALLVTGVGGLALLAGLLLMVPVGGSMEISALLTRSEIIRGHSLYLPILLLVAAGAFTKSAQVPFHFWLPNAMEAPTPVSAYLHSVTMVKAGIYLLARLSPIMAGTDQWLVLVTGVGAATMFTGAWLAFHQTDLKRILAYSTVSVLGLLTMLLGLGTELAAKAAAVYLLAHSLYKGALFLAAGGIHHETGEREIDKLGGLRQAMPLTAAATALGAFSMAGLPPLLGFVAKEQFYEATAHSHAAGVVITAVSAASSILLVAVSFTFVLKPFIGDRVRTPRNPHEAPFSMWLGPVVLAGLGLVIGVAPSLVDRPIITPTISSILGHEAHMHLALWHGFSPILALSAVTVAIGIGLYAGHDRLRHFLSPFKSIARFGPAQGYDRGLDGLFGFAELQTKILQNGHLRYYLLTIFAATVCLAGYKLLFGKVPLNLVGLTDIRFHEAGLAGLILAAAFRAITTRSRIGAIVSLGVVGAGVGLIYLLFGAPDLAMTQVLIETLTVVLFVLVFYQLPRFFHVSSKTAHVRDALISLITGGFFTVLVLVANTVQFHPTISSYFGEHSYEMAHGRNIVNVILVDFRGFDTMGEITVLAMAGLGIFALLKLRTKRGTNR